jgi:hypothetical protein
MAVHASHAALPYPIRGARFSVLVPYLDADGDPTAPTTPDTEVSKDNGAAADAAEEVSATSGMDGMGLITFTGAELDCSCLAANFKVASGPKATLMTLYPRPLASVGTGTLSAGSAGGGTLGTLLAYDLTGCIIKTTGGTGGGGTGGANNQARVIATYNTGTGAFTVVPDWETTPSTDTTYEVLLPEGVTLGMLRALNPTVAGRTLDVSAGGEAGLDWNNVGTPGATVNLAATTVKTATDVETDTQDIQSRLPTALTGAGNMKADALAISGDSTAADNAEAFFDGTGYAGTGNTIPTVTTVTGAVGSVAGNVGGNVAGSVGSVAGNVTGSVGSLATQAKADVNTEVLDVLVTDTFAEPSAVPAATSSLKDKIGWVCALWRNKRTQTSTTETLRNDADSASIATSSKTDSGGTFTRGEWS